MREIKNIKLSDGCHFLGHFENGKRVGYGIKTYPNGATFAGLYENDVRHGTGFKTHANGTRIKVEYINGIKKQ